VTEVQDDEEGSVLAVQSMPFVEVAAIVDGPPATATKTPLPKVTERQLDEEGSVPAVQLRPFEEVAAVVPDEMTATKTPFPKVIERQDVEDGSVPAVQVIPSGEEATPATPELEAIATKTPLQLRTSRAWVSLSLLALPYGSITTARMLSAPLTTLLV